MKEGWSRDELKASVDAYLDMQRKERLGQPFVKKRYYEELAARFGRGEKAFEYRMRNISYVLAIMGREWLPGLKPARNIRGRTAADVEAFIAEATAHRATPVVGSEIIVREAIRKGLIPKPSGRPPPEPKTVAITTRQRDPHVKAWVLQQAGGVCECCRQQAPFLTFDGLPYLEVHHIRHLAEGGSDTVSNTVAVCPNCHRQLHYGQKPRKLVEELFASLERLERE